MARSFPPTLRGSDIVVRQAPSPMMAESQLSLSALVAFADMLVSAGDMDALEHVLTLIRARLVDDTTRKFDS